MSIQFSKNMQFKCKNSKLSKPRYSYIWPSGGSLSRATTSGQGGPGSDGNEGVLRIPQSPSTTGTSPSDCLVSYAGHSLNGAFALCREVVGVSYSPSRQGFWNINRSHNPRQKTRLSFNWPSKRTYHRVDFTVLADHRIKEKEKERKDKYLNLARELKKLWNIKVTVVL